MWIIFIHRSTHCGKLKAHNHDVINSAPARLHTVVNKVKHPEDGHTPTSFSFLNGTFTSAIIYFIYHVNSLFDACLRVMVLVLRRQYRYIWYKAVCADYVSSADEQQFR